MTDSQRYYNRGKSSRMRKFLDKKETEEHPPGTWYVTKFGELNYHSIPESKKLVVVEPGPPVGTVVVLGRYPLN